MHVHPWATQSTLQPPPRPRSSREKRPKNSKTRPKNNTIKPLPGGANRKKDRKIALFTAASIYYICTMYENPGKARLPCPQLPTPMPTTLTDMTEQVSAIRRKMKEVIKVFSPYFEMYSNSKPTI